MLIPLLLGRFWIWSPIVLLESNWSNQSITLIGKNIMDGNLSRSLGPNSWDQWYKVHLAPGYEGGPKRICTGINILFSSLDNRTGCVLGKFTEDMRSGRSVTSSKLPIKLGLNQIQKRLNKTLFKIHNFFSYW